MPNGSHTILAPKTESFIIKVTTPSSYQFPVSADYAICLNTYLPLTTLLTGPPRPNFVQLGCNFSPMQFLALAETAVVRQFAQEVVLLTYGIVTSGLHGFLSVIILYHSNKLHENLSGIWVVFSFLYEPDHYLLFCQMVRNHGWLFYLEKHQQDRETSIFMLGSKITDARLPVETWTTLQGKNTSKTFNKVSIDFNKYLDNAIIF